MSDVIHRVMNWWGIPAWAWALVAVLMIVGIAIEATSGGTFADDMNHACAHHRGVFTMNAYQGGGVCRDGTAVAP